MGGSYSERKESEGDEVKEIWGITTGSYSDYRILFLCKSEELADRVVKENPYEKTEWEDVIEKEKFTVIESMDEIIKETVYEVQVDPDGNEIERNESINVIINGEDSEYNKNTCQQWIMPVNHTSFCKSTISYDDALVRVRAMLDGLRDAAS